MVMEHGCSDWTTLCSPGLRYYLQGINATLSILGNAHEFLPRICGVR
jgi:hypothetical protein